MLIPKQITTAHPAPIERRSNRKPVVLDDRWMLYAFPLVWFAVLLVVAALIWGFQSLAIPFFSR